MVCRKLEHRTDHLDEDMAPGFWALPNTRWSTCNLLIYNFNFNIGSLDFLFHRCLAVGGYTCLFFAAAGIPCTGPPLSPDDALPSLKLWSSRATFILTYAQLDL